MCDEVDEAIAHAIGLEKRTPLYTDACWYLGDDFAYRVSEFRPSTDWEYLDPLIDQLALEIEYVHSIPIVKLPDDDVWQEGVDDDGPNLRLGVIRAILYSQSLAYRSNLMYIPRGDHILH
tara:strand:+ start:3954 stop:4313 length:360 start_codon:yes stop_codon:yes gene_type:complete